MDLDKTRQENTMFADRAKILIRSGKGGDGHVSFRRELFVPNGGPDGGDGGRGGDVIFVVDEGLNTLTDFRHRRKFAAENGEEGGKKKCHGKDGADLILKVPAGTVIKDAESDKVIADMSGDNKRQVILKGGRGGQGNSHYATATMQAPKYAQPGGEGIEIEVKLELKVIADVGLVGFPNVGKSTFINSYAGKACAKTGNKPGVTKGKQWIRLSKSVELLDTPGILWPKFEDQKVGLRLALIGSIRDEILNTDELAVELIRFLKTQYPGILTERYEVEETQKETELLCGIAENRKCITKGGELDYSKAAALLIDEFRSGKLGKVTLEWPKEQENG